MVRLVERKNNILLGLTVYLKKVMFYYSIRLYYTDLYQYIYRNIHHNIYCSHQNIQNVHKNIHYLQCNHPSIHQSIVKALFEYQNQQRFYVQVNWGLSTNLYND